MINKEEILTDTLASIRLAKLATKGKGFNIPTIYYYGIKTSGEIDPEVNSLTPTTNWNTSTHLVSCPSQSLLAKWLRKEHDLHVYTDHWYSEWRYNIQKVKHCTSGENGMARYQSSEDAMEEGLYEAMLTL